MYSELKAVKIRASLWQYVWMSCEFVIRVSVEKLILILKIKSLCEKWGCCFEVRTLVAIPEILAPRWEIEEDRCQCVVNLCHGLIPHNPSLIVITCINMMRLIGINIQMIIKAKILIILYKDFVLSHSASLEDKQRI